MDLHTEIDWNGSDSIGLIAFPGMGKIEWKFEGKRIVVLEKREGRSILVRLFIFARFYIF